MQIAWLERFALSVGGATVGAAVVAAVEARALGPQHAGIARAFAADLGVLAPIAGVTGLAVGLATLLLEPDRVRSWGEHLARLRDEPVLSRSRTAAAVPLAVLGACAWLVVMARVATVELGRGTPAEAGARVAGVGALVGVLLFAFGAAMVSPLRKALARGAGRVPSLVDPTRTGSGALGLALVAMAWGVHAGDASGMGGGPLGVFGVLKRPELDLRPAIDLLAIAAPAYLFPMAASRARWLVYSAGLSVLAAGATAWCAGALGQNAELARVIETRAPLGKVALSVLRAATDRDHDGASPYFGGGDCDDRDPRTNPGAFDVPGNGRDEDCTGADAPVPPPPLPRAVDKAPEIRPDLNVILITVDTLRADTVGFMGYPKPTTPNLDRLARRGTVFERAYSLASYTGKSLGPLLIGKYPSEAPRDGAHFTTYYGANVLVAERLHQAGVHTLGAASHWYFKSWSGMSQGMDVWDMSAQPSQGQGESDTSVTSAELSRAALALLQRPEIAGGRFFAWFHYFDPHAQYMPHEGAPDFLGDGKGGVAATRALYDGEVWFTDAQIGRVLDFVFSQPWGARTAIIVTSDHGEAFGEHGMSWHGIELWECLVRVPMVVYVPGVGPRRVGLKRGHIDLAPTILGLFGMHAEPGELSGDSLLPDLLGVGPTEERDVYIDMPAGPYTGMRKALITGPTPGKKIVWYGAKSWAAFDLATDPDEKVDLAADPAQTAPLIDAMQSKRATISEIEVAPLRP